MSSHATIPRTRRQFCHRRRSRTWPPPRPPGDQRSTSAGAEDVRATSQIPRRRHCQRDVQAGKQSHVPCVLSARMLTLCSRRGSLSTCTTVQNSSLGMRYSHPNSVHRRLKSHSRVDGLARRSSHGYTDMMLLLWWSKQFKKSLL